jgi:hypothetical protein
VSAVAASVHANSGAYVTVGSATLEGLPIWKGLGLDYYQAHWYDPMASGNACAFCVDDATVRARYALDKPLVIGETYIGSDTAGRFDAWFNKGYAGAWPWSLFANSTADHLAIDMTQAAAFGSSHPSIGPRVGTPDPTPTPTPTPTASPSPTPATYRCQILNPDGTYTTMWATPGGGSCP